MADVVVKDLFKRYGEFQAVHGINFAIADGEFVVLVGPSGCGKSTILRMIAGLETVTAGEILIDGTVVNDTPPRERDIAMVFQDYALYPHMSVRQNLGFGLKMRGTARGAIKDAVERTAAMLQIEGLLDRKPKELSGGQRQRVAIGRAIAREPQLFLFDEPLSNLDAQLRVEMRTQIKRLHMNFHATSVYVTHDQTEAMTLADRIVALRSGNIEQIGTPEQLYTRPVNRFVAGFIGSPKMNFISGYVLLEDDKLFAIPAGVPTVRFPLPGPHHAQAGQEVVMGIRPEHLTDSWTEHGRGGLVPIDLKVELSEPLGADTLVVSHIGAAEIVCRVSAGSKPRAGSSLQVMADAKNVHLFDPKTGAALHRD
jgi:multiple sugar transport system ATP-binding protein